MVFGLLPILLGSIKAESHIAKTKHIPTMPVCASTLMYPPPDSFRPTALFRPTPCAANPMPMIGEDLNSAIRCDQSSSREVFSTVTSKLFFFCSMAPAFLHLSSQERIHSPSPHPYEPKSMIFLPLFIPF